VARIASVVSNGCNPDPRVLREAGWLVDLGHDVTIHAFGRQEQYVEIDESNGVKIIRHRVGKTPYGGTISTYLGLRRFRKSVAKSLNEYDLLHCHDADTLALAKSVSCPIIFDMHDLHHTWVLMPAPNSWIRKFVSNRMKSKMLKNVKKADLVITSSTGFSDWLLNHNIQSTVVENRPKNQSQLPLPEQPTIGYFGMIREIKSFKLLANALLQIPESKRPRLFIAGEGTCANEVEELFTQYPEIITEIKGPFIHSEYPQMMKKISMMFAMYRPDRGNIRDGALPSKMFEAAAHGRPSIVNGNTPMGTLCESENLGLAVDWNDAQGLAKAIIELEGLTTHLEIDESRERERFIDMLNHLKI